MPPPAIATFARWIVGKVSLVADGNISKKLFLEEEMDKQFYNTREISAMMGICYAKALALIKYSGITYTRIGRTYLVSKKDFEEFFSKTRTIEIEE